MCYAHNRIYRSTGEVVVDIPNRRRRRGSGQERDSLGRKQCGRCAQWLPEEDFKSAGVSDLYSYCRDCDRDYQMKYKYGVTRAEWDALFEAQGSACAICSSDSPRGRGWATDHDHACCPGKRSCGKCIRGILCSPCNVGLGHFGDDLDRLAQARAYLEGAAA